ncbi:hypothetical protein ACTXT7_003991 [Hymenolepis weldensis]
MFKEVKPTVKDFVEKQKREREQRKTDRDRQNAALRIQKFWRGYTSRKKLKYQFRNDCIAFLESTRTDGCESRSMCSATMLPKIINKMKYGFRLDGDKDIFEGICRYVLISANKEDEVSYLYLLQQKDYIVPWIAQTRWMLSICVKYFAILNPANESDFNMLNLLLSFVLTMTNCTSITERNRLTYTGSHSALFNRNFFLSLTLFKPMILSDFSSESNSLFVVHILTVPGFVLHINSLANETYDVIVREKLCSRIITFLYEKLPDPLLLSSLDGSYILCLIANLIQLSLLEIEVLVDLCEQFCIVLSKLLHVLGGYVGQKKSNLTCWHPILGWFSRPLDN